MFTITICYAQIDIVSGNVATFTTASEGDIYKDENNTFYIGLANGSLRTLGIINTEGVANNDILRWNATTSQWEQQSFNTTTSTSTSIRSVIKSRIQFNPVSNLNSNAFTPLQLSNTFIINQIGASIDQSGLHGITGLNGTSTFYCNN